MRPEIGLRVGVLLCLGACGSSSSIHTDASQAPPQVLLAEAAADSSLHLVGELKGPGLGLGPEVSFEAWIRSDRWLRADFRFQDEDGAFAHEVLVWGPDTCLLFDRLKGRYTAMGEHPGEFELEQGSFHVQHALWLALGLWVGEEALPGRWEKGEWRGRDGELGLRAELQGQKLKWTELVWRGDRLRATPQDRQNSPWGLIPRRLELSGSLMETVVNAEWRAESIPSFGDEILDPLLDP